MLNEVFTSKTAQGSRNFSPLWHLFCFFTIFISSFFIYFKETFYWTQQFNPLRFQLAVFCITVVNLCWLFNSKQVKLQITTWDLATFAYLIYNILNTYFRSSGETYHGETYLATAYLYLFILVRFSNTEIEVQHKLILLLITFGVFNLCISVLQLIQVLPVFNKGFLITGAFINPSQLAGFLALILPLCLVASEVDIRRQLLFRGISLAFLLTILLTGSRAAILAIALVFGFQYFTKLKYANWLKNLKGRAFISIAIALCLYFFYIVRQDSANGRLLIWKIGCRMIADAPILGGGIGFVKSNFNLYQGEYFKAGEGTTYAKMLASNNVYMFNEYIRIFVESGIIGFLLFSVMILTSLRTRNVREDYTILYRSLLRVMGILAIFSLFSYPFATIPIHGLFLVCLALIQTCKSGRRDVITLNSSLVQILTIPIICITIFLTYTVFKNIRSVYVWRKAALVTNTPSSTTLSIYRKIMPSLSNNPDFLLTYGSALCENGLYKDALPVLNKVKTYRNDNILYCQIASCHVGLSQDSLVVLNYETAANMVPFALTPKFLLFDFYRSTNREKLARSVAQEILRTPVKIQTIKAGAIREEAQRFLNEHMEF